MRPKIIELPKTIDPRGNLSFFENHNCLSFEIARTYWIYDVPGVEKRGGHAFREQLEFIADWYLLGKEVENFEKILVRTLVQVTPLVTGN